MTQSFDKNPILNSPYRKPEKHWNLDERGKPTGGITSSRRMSVHMVPIPESRRSRRRDRAQADLEMNEERDNPIINLIRQKVDDWRPVSEEDKRLTYVTRRLLSHWRSDAVDPRPFFCQLEAVETFIWLNEVAPKIADGKRILADLADMNRDANSELFRLAAKMATGSGKTRVMAMMIAYHTINKARRAKSSRFSDSFLVVTPGITIKDRLRVLYPSDPSNMYTGGRGIVPDDFTEDIKKARIVITNYHSFGLREKTKLSKGVKEVLRGNDDSDISTKESEGEMLRRACKELLRSRDVIVINDEAHHCYRHKSASSQASLSREEKEEVKKHDKAARLWISGIEALQRKVGLRCVYDLSATPFFLRGSGYREGELFPWVTSDFGLMDAIECGIVKVPRVPVEDGAWTVDGIPVYRNVYKHVKSDLPRRGRAKQEFMDPEKLPPALQGALQALYGIYSKTYDVWVKKGIKIPPVFIVVCNNTATSKLVYDLLAGYERESGSGFWTHGKFSLFDNIGADGKPLARMRTLLIDSEQLDSGEDMSKEFKQAAATEIEVFKKEMRRRFPDRDLSKLTDEDLLREVMNTVGKEGRLGEQIRCVVSVSMLTEGWDTNNVTHILGVRAFGTQLLCEQVVGRGLRRYNYELDENGCFTPEYADVFGVPFVFAAESATEVPPVPPAEMLRVRAMDERAHLAIIFPRVRSYTVKIPEDRLVAKFGKDSGLTITPEDAPPVTQQEGIIGEGITITLEGLKKHRMNEVVFYLAAEAARRFAGEDGRIRPERFRDLVPIVRLWLRDYLRCLGNTFPQYMLWKVFAVEAAERIYRACRSQTENTENQYIPIVDPFTPEGSSFYVDFMTRKKLYHATRADKCHVNNAVCDSDWELSFCAMLEDDPGVYAYIRNDGLGFEVPYRYLDKPYKYRPDFIALINDGRGEGDLLHLVIEIKGLRDDKDKAKADTMRRLWVPSVSNDTRWGRWDFVEILDMYMAREILGSFTAGGKANKE